MEANSKLEMDKQQSMSESGNLAYQLEQARGSMAGKRCSCSIVPYYFGDFILKDVKLT